MSSKSPPLFLVPNQFYPFGFAFPSCGFYKKRVFNQHIILFTYHSEALSRDWIMAVRYTSIFWFITSLLLKSDNRVASPAWSRESSRPYPSHHIPSCWHAIFCCSCSCLWLRNILVYRTRSMPYSSPEVKCVEIKKLCLRLISEMTEDRRSKQLYLTPL